MWTVCIAVVRHHLHCEADFSRCKSLGVGPSLCKNGVFGKIAGFTGNKVSSFNGDLSAIIKIIQWFWKYLD